MTRHLLPFEHERDRMSSVKPIYGVNKKLVVSFTVLEWIYWGIMGSFGSYFVTWMLHIGYAQSFVSILLIVYLVSGMLGQFVLSSLCDQWRTNKKIFLFGVAAAAVAQLGMYFSKSKWILTACYVCYGFFPGPWVLYWTHGYCVAFMAI